MSEAVHGMVPGSHERGSGPECRCGAEWSQWLEQCAVQYHARVGVAAAEEGRF